MATSAALSTGLEPAALAALKGDRRLSVCLPAHNEAATVGEIVERILEDLGAVADEVVVVDDRSTDGTAAVAADAGARVVVAADEVPGFTDLQGKGAALWAGLHATKGEIVVWCDADIVDFDTSFVSQLALPLLADPDVAFVKGYYDRPGDKDTGGRTTELVARPAIAMLLPHLAWVQQPLSGEYAGRRDVLERLAFVEGYGVDLGLLCDVAATCGVEAITEVDLGTRIHRNRRLDELGPQALAVLQTAFRRAGIDVPGAREATLTRPGAPPTVVAQRELPPLVQLASYAASR